MNSTQSSDNGRYAARGVSSSKNEVHAVVDRLDPGLFPGAFCKITEDFLTGNPALCNVSHSDGSGTKSLLRHPYSFPDKRSAPRVPSHPEENC